MVLYLYFEKISTFYQDNKVIYMPFGSNIAITGEKLSTPSGIWARHWEYSFVLISVVKINFIWVDLLDIENK